MHRASGSHDVIEKQSEHTPKSFNKVQNLHVYSAIRKRARDRDIANDVYFRDYPTLQSTGKAYGMAMKCIVKGLWENILVATAFVLFTYEEWNMSWNRGGSLIFWQDTEETDSGPLHCLISNIFS